MAKRATVRPKRARPRARRPTKPPAATATVRALERRVERLLAARDGDRRRHARALAAIRRAADRQLAVMMQEIADLRHLEARSTALARLLAEREQTLTAQAQRIAELETLLRSPTQLG